MWHSEEVAIVASSKWHVVLKNDEVEVDAEHVREDPSGTLRFFNELANGSHEPVAAFSKGDWTRYYQPDKVKQVDTGGPLIA